MKRTGISRQPSKAKRDFDAEWAKVLPSVLARGCEFSAYAEDWIAEAHPCRGPLVGHHAKGRKVADANAPENMRCLCNYHHNYVHDLPRWAREVGLMVSRIA